MHMHMPGMPKKHHGHIMRKKMWWASAFGILWMLGASFLVLAVSKNACAAMITARLRVLNKIPDAFTEEERMLLEHRIASSALRGY